MAGTTVSDAGMMAELGYVPVGPWHGPESEGWCVDGADVATSEGPTLGFVRVLTQLHLKPAGFDFQT